MLDGDIVCLGSNLLEDRPQQPRVIGISLHVEKSGESEAYSLLFKRENTSVIHIGRRSGHETDKCHGDNLTSAMFRCAVVSRKHAKIVFSDSGSVYIVDSNSHHGTHVRSPGETFSRMIKPEFSTILKDGDTITFGKSVGKGDEWVKPVVARVQLLYASPPLLSKALTIPSPSSSDKSRSSSGRYGVHDDASSSDDSLSSYSDIEEIDPPPSSQKSSGLPPAICAGSDPSPIPVSLDLSHATSAVKRLLSPAIRKLPSMSEIIGESLGFLDSSEKSQSFFTSPLKYDALYSPIYTPPRLNLFSLHNSRSNSPMELASPSPGPLVVVSGGAPFASETENLVDSSSSAVPKEMEIAPVITESHHEVSHESYPTPPLLRFLQDASTSEVQPSSAVVPVSTSAEEKTDSSTEIKEILEKLRHLETSVAKLQSSRRKYKARFNSNVAFMSRKLSEIDDRFAEVDAEYNVLCDQVDAVQHSDLPDLARQVEELDETVDSLLAGRDQDRDKMPETLEFQPLEDREDVKAAIKSLHELVDEMRDLHDRTKTEMSKEVLEIRAMREKATEDMAQARAERAAAAVVANCAPMPPAQVETPALTSLKRKRDDMDEDEDDVADTAGSSADAPSLSEEIHENDMPENQVDATTIALETPDVHAHTIHRPDEPPPRKRIRSVSSVIAHTATAVTIGAVITWSALAFS